MELHKSTPVIKFHVASFTLHKNEACGYRCGRNAVILFCTGSCGYQLCRACFETQDILLCGLRSNWVGVGRHSTCTETKEVPVFQTDGLLEIPTLLCSKLFDQKQCCTWGLSKDVPILSEWDEDVGEI